MSALLVLLVLTAALLHASWNAMAKSGGNPLFGISAYQLIGAVVSASLIWFVPAPEPASWRYILLSIIVHNVYYFTLARCYNSGDLSLVYPLFRGLAPVLVAIGGSVFAGEYLSLTALLGVGLVSAGLIALALFGNKTSRPTAATLKWALITAVMIAGYTIVDGLGVRQVSHSLSYILWLFVFEVVPIGIWLLMTQRNAWLGYMYAQPIKIVVGGVASAVAYGLVIFAMSLGAMALVSSLRETSVIFAAIIGALFLREPFGRQRIIAAVVVALGVMVIRYYGSIDW